MIDRFSNYSELYYASLEANRQSDSALENELMARLYDVWNEMSESEHERAEALLRYPAARSTPQPWAEAAIRSGVIECRISSSLGDVRAHPISSATLGRASMSSLAVTIEFVGMPASAPPEPVPQPLLKRYIDRGEGTNSGFDASMSGNRYRPVTRDKLLSPRS